ncbi:MAG: SPOR domain-containing protein [Treponema sp.]|jgi:cell division septation protein DedD|nr:SPOR domain-containing protein [Treponema sp.]
MTHKFLFVLLASVIVLSGCQTLRANLEGELLDYQSAEVTWDYSQSLTADAEYELEVAQITSKNKKNPVFESIAKITQASASYRQYGLRPGAEYQYRITEYALDTSRSQTKKQTQLRLPQKISPAISVITPLDIIIEKKTPNARTVELKWDSEKLKPENTYELQALVWKEIKKKNKNYETLLTIGGSKRQNTAPPSSYRHENREPGAEYQYRIIDTSDLRWVSPVYSVIMPLDIQLTGRQLNANSVEIAWAPAKLDAEHRYELQFSQGGADFVPVKPVSASTKPVYVHNNLLPAMKYDYRIIDADDSRRSSLVFSADTSPMGGIYIGILAFAGDVKNITPGFVFLDPSGKQQALDYINGAYPLPARGSALLFAIEKALTDIETAKKENRLPQNTKSLLVAVTDELDTGSTNPYLSVPGGNTKNDIVLYRDYIEQQIKAKTIGNVPLAVQAKDLPAPLWQLLPTAENIKKADSIARIIDTMNFNASSQHITLALSTPWYPEGTELTVVFDGKSPDTSDQYIKGIINRTPGTSSLDIKESAGIQVIGTPMVKTTESEVQYAVTISDKDIRLNNHPLVKSMVKQWYKYPAELINITDWQLDTALDTVMITDYGVDFPDKQATVLYLILNCRESLDNNLDKVRNTAKKFIEKAYSAVSAPGAPTTLKPESPDPIPVESEPARIPQPLPPPPALPPLSSRQINPAETAPLPSMPNLGITYDLDAYWIQVGAFVIPENANQAKVILEAKRYPAQLTPAVVDGQYFKRVRTGPYKTRAEAEQDLEKVRSSFQEFAESYIP